MHIELKLEQGEKPFLDRQARIYGDLGLAIDRMGKISPSPFEAPQEDDDHGLQR